MKLSDILATRCIQVKQAALNPDVARDEFENLGAKERVARSMADRYKTIAKDRADEESEKSPLQTATDRLYPVPHTGTEALVRMPLIGAAGIAGHNAVERNELPDAAGLLEMSAHPGRETPRAAPPAPPALGEFGTHMKQMLEASGVHKDPHGAAHYLEKTIRSDPDNLAHLLSKDQNGVYTNAHKLTDLGEHFNGNRQTALQTMEERLRHLGFEHETVKGPSGKDVSAWKHNNKGGLLTQPGTGKGKIPPVPLDKADITPFTKLVQTVAEPKGTGSVPGEKVLPTPLSPFGQRLQQRLTARQHHDPAGAARQVEDIISRDPHLARKALGITPDMLAGNEVKATRGAFKNMGVDPHLVSETAHTSLNMPEGASTAARLATKSKWKRLGGAGLGLAAGSVLTGLPLALRALHQRRYGGEAAVRARDRVNEELGTANSASKRRDEILAELSKKE